MRNLRPDHKQPEPLVCDSVQRFELSVLKWNSEAANAPEHAISAEKHMRRSTLADGLSRFARRPKTRLHKISICEVVTIQSFPIFMSCRGTEMGLSSLLRVRKSVSS